MMTKCNNTSSAVSVSIKWLLILLFAMGTLRMSAQKPSNEFSVYVGGGVPVLLSDGATVNGFSGDAGLGYTAFVSQQLAVHFGAGFGLSNVTVNAANLNTLTPALKDDNNYLYDLHTTLSGYKEVQRTTFISVPVVLQFQTNSEFSHDFYAMGGAKMLFWYRTNYETSVASLYNAAYYPEFDNWAATQTFAGLGKFDGATTTGNFTLGLSVMLAFEAGMKWRISQNVSLYTGAYLDYALSDPAKDQRKPLSNYIAAEQLKDLTLLQYTDKINLMTVGIKLRLSFSFSRFRSITPIKRKVPTRKSFGKKTYRCYC